MTIRMGIGHLVLFLAGIITNGRAPVRQAEHQSAIWDIKMEIGAEIASEPNGHFHVTDDAMENAS